MAEYLGVMGLMVTQPAAGAPFARQRSHRLRTASMRALFFVAPLQQNRAHKWIACLGKMVPWGVEIGHAALAKLADITGSAAL